MLSRNIFHQHKTISNKEIYKTYKIFFGTLVSHSRLEIINLLRKGAMTVSEIVKLLKMQQAHVSHDLARLRKCGFVKAKREGQFVHYRLNEKTIGPLMTLIDKHMSEYCIHILHEIKGKKDGN